MHNGHVLVLRVGTPIANPYAHRIEHVHVGSVVGCLYKTPIDIDMMVVGVTDENKNKSTNCVTFKRWQPTNFYLFLSSSFFCVFVVVVDVVRTSKLIVKRIMVLFRLNPKHHGRHDDETQDKHTKRNSTWYWVGISSVCVLVNLLWISVTVALSRNFFFVRLWTQHIILFCITCSFFESEQSLASSLSHPQTHWMKSFDFMFAAALLKVNTVLRLFCLFCCVPNSVFGVCALHFRRDLSSTDFGEKFSFEGKIRENRPITVIIRRHTVTNWIN